MIRSVIFEGVVIAPDYGFGFGRVCGLCRNEVFPVDQV